MTDIRTEVTVVGGGVAGLSAAAAAARYGRQVTLLERGMPGGQLLNTHMVENFPGVDTTEGVEIGMRLLEFASQSGVDVVTAEVTSLHTVDGEHIVETDGARFISPVVVVATGSSLRLAGVPGETEFSGRGVATCAACDGALFRGKDVVVAGGGDSAAEDALILANFARHVYLVHRGAEIQAQRVLVERVRASHLIEVWPHSEVIAVHGDVSVQSVDVRDSLARVERHLDVSGVFFMIGLEPNVDWLSPKVPQDAARRIEVDLELRTKIPGLLAVGDLRQGSARLFTSVAGDGVTAALTAHRYLENGQWNAN